MQNTPLFVDHTRTHTIVLASSATFTFPSSLSSGYTSANTVQTSIPSWQFILVGGFAGSTVTFLILAFFICRRRLRRSKLQEAIHTIEPFVGPSISIPPTLHQGKHQEAVVQVPTNSELPSTAQPESQLPVMRPEPSLKSFMSAPPSYHSGPGALWASIYEHYPVPSAVSAQSSS